MTNEGNLKPPDPRAQFWLAYEAARQEAPEDREALTRYCRRVGESQYAVRLGHLTYGNRFSLVYAVARIPYDERRRFRHFEWHALTYRAGEAWAVISCSDAQPYERLLGRYC